MPKQASDMASAHSLQGLMKWLGRDEWRHAFKDVLDLYLMQACEAASMKVEEALDPRGDNAATMTGTETAARKRGTRGYALPNDEAVAHSIPRIEDPFGVTD